MLFKKKDPKFVLIKDSFSLDPFGKIRLIAVKRGPCKGFRHYSGGGNYNEYTYRGENESFSHLGNKEAISQLKSFSIFCCGEKVRLYVKDVEIEKNVLCNGHKYKVDVFFSLEKTEPSKYLDMFHGELWLEVFHKCPVDQKQAEDFMIENLALYEYRISDDCLFYDNITSSGYDRRVEQLTQKYMKYGLPGFAILRSRNFEVTWPQNKNGNYCSKIGDVWFTVFHAKSGYYGIMYNGKSCYSMNGNKFSVPADAFKVAEYIGFELINNRKPKGLG
ncbi:MAG: hypothetical protein MJ093_09510 [Saccharofermentans sp.]|nr:hypothetical protein [Saccharofermentans sp.]